MTQDYNYENPWRFTGESNRSSKESAGRELIYTEPSWMGNDTR